MSANKFFVTVIILFLIEVISSKAQDNIEKIETEKLIKKQFKIYPQLEIQDLYKFLHQAAMGSEHAVKDTEAARKWMENEIANLDWTHTEDLIDTLSPDGNIVRVNLRPYLKAGYNPEKLLTAFIETANGYKGNKETLGEYLNVVLEMIDNGVIDFSEKETKILFDELKQKNYPAVHHSKKYEELYSPAYRVVAKKYITFLKDRD